ncbi:Ldh family oxidoreductase [Parafrigoribacterium mesophilum]|uniref:Ldh family oxidoreductase n=1 Tax=Parafrigoribacterium mesophilum TaxID=433646 RepID=UPI0031FD1814
MTSYRVQAAPLAALGTRVLTALGVPEPDAALVSDSLVTANLWGHPSHGMLRLGWYAARLRSGAMSAVTAPSWAVDRGALAVLDGHEGVGQVLAATACDDAARRAGQHGVGVVAVRNSNHFGTAAYWTRRMAQAGCVGILTTNGSPAMAPWGGREKTVGANPWSIAVPGGARGPVVLDIANTGVARGKIYAAAQRGERIPTGWATDGDGRPTTDPAAAIDGLLQPAAGHKGYGISFMMDVLSGVLTGSSFATAVIGPYLPQGRSGCGHLAIALRVDAMIDPAEFERKLSELIATTKAVPLAPGFDEVFYPGELETRAEAIGRRDGILLPGKTITELRALAASCGVAFDVDLRLEHLPGPPEGPLGATERTFAVFVTFDILRSTTDPHRFHLYEVYASESAFREDHRQAAHYPAWREVSARCVVPGSHVNTYAETVSSTELLDHG